MELRNAKKRLFVGATVAAALVVLGATLVGASGGSDLADNPWPYAPPADAPVLVAVGDISCQPDVNSTTQPGEAATPNDTCSQNNIADVNLRNQAQAATANEVESMQPSVVAILGDEQYQIGSLADFEGSYDQTYGAFKFLQRPSPGNHEFYSTHGQKGEDGVGYFDYFNGYQLNPLTGKPVTAPDPLDPARVEPVPRTNGQAGVAGEGWYSYDLGSWHIISLNAECSIGDNAATTMCTNPPAWYQQETTWLANDLANDHASCTMAYWHQPTWSVTTAPVNATTPGSDSAESTASEAWWKLLVAEGADVVLNGHEHVYARSAPMNAYGQADSHGIRQFIVGTGGEALDVLHENSADQVSVPNLQAAQGSGSEFQNGVTTNGYEGAFGVMKMTLSKDGYTWDYESATAPLVNDTPAWASFSDSGSAKCHGPAQNNQGS